MNSNKSVENSHLSQTPVKTGIHVPVGHLIVNPKWRNSDLTTTLQSIIYNSLRLGFRKKNLSDILVCPLFVDLSIIVEITIKSTNKIKYGIAYL